MYPPESKSEWKDKEHADELTALKADNAALMESIHAFHEAWKSGRDTLALAAMLRRAKDPHTGAALLEEVKSLRERVKTLEDDLRQKAADMLEHQASVATARDEALEEALREATDDMLEWKEEGLDRQAEGAENVARRIGTLKGT